MRRQQYNGQLTPLKILFLTRQVIDHNPLEGGWINNGQLYQKKYFWDSENRLMAVKINKKNSNNTFTVAFAYNGDGQRIYKEVVKPDDTVESKILYVRNSFGEVVEEYEAKGTDDFEDISTSTYIFGNGKRIMSLTAEDTKTYYLSDILGSNSLLTDIEGNPTMLTKYDEFGNTYYEFTQHNEVGAVVENNYKYTGKPFDREIGLYYYGARYYNPEWGRWVSRDANEFRFEKTQTLNSYIYVLNNPIYFVDANGFVEVNVKYLDRKKLKSQNISNKLLKSYVKAVKKWENEFFSDEKVKNIGLNRTLKETVLEILFVNDEKSNLGMADPDYSEYFQINIWKVANAGYGPDSIEFASILIHEAKHCEFNKWWLNAKDKRFQEGRKLFSSVWKCGFERSYLINSFREVFGYQAQIDYLIEHGGSDKYKNSLIKQRDMFLQELEGELGINRKDIEKKFNIKFKNAKGK